MANPLTTIIALFLLSIPSSLSAHEFWLDLQQGQIDPGEKIVGGLRVGEMLNGDPYPYLSHRFRSFTIHNGDRATPVRGNEGDFPALSQVAAEAGLHVISQLSVAFSLTYDDIESFAAYLDYEGSPEILDLHRERGLPESGFAERYIRCVKALVQVGPVSEEHSDVIVGLPLELVARTNPYAADSDSLRVQLLWQGKPLAGRQINVFHDASEVSLSHVVTDRNGIAELPLSSRGHYLLNAVHIEAVDNPPVYWQSHWATLSFRPNRPRN